MKKLFITFCIILGQTITAQQFTYLQKHAFFKNEYQNNSTHKSIQLDSIQIFEIGQNTFHLNGMEVNQYFTHITGKYLAQSKEIYKIATENDTLNTFGHIVIGQHFDLYKEVYRYDTSDRLSEVLIYTKNNEHDLYSLRYKNKYWYNNNGNISKLKFYRFNITNNNFLLTNHVVFNYQGNKLVEEISREFKTRINYQNNQPVQLITYYRPNTNAHWENRSIKKYYYNQQNKLSALSFKMYRVAEQNRMPIDSLTKTYHPLQTTIIKYDLIVPSQGSPSLQTDRKKIYHFDTSENNILTENYSRIVSFGEVNWTFSGNDQRFFDLSIQSKNIAKPYMLTPFSSHFYYYKNKIDSEITQAKKIYHYSPIQTTNIDENLKFTANIYPNPTQDNLFVEIAQSSLFEIYNMQGKLLVEGELSKGKNRIKIAELKSGSYLLKIRDLEKSMVIIKR